MSSFVPRLDVLPPPQRRLWPELRAVPPHFVLYGGTAIALQLGHRISIDFDLFADRGFDPDRLYRELPFLAGSQVIQKAADTLTCLIERGGTVQVSLFGVPQLSRVHAPLVAPDNALKVAALIDLAGTKAAVIQKRAEARDYLDLDALLASGSVDLPAALAAGCVIYGRMFNPQITLKALSFYEDGNLPSLPGEVQRRLLEAVRAVDLDRLPALAESLSRDPAAPGTGESS